MLKTFCRKVDGVTWLGRHCKTKFLTNFQHFLNDILLKLGSKEVPNRKRALPRATNIPSCWTSSCVPRTTRKPPAVAEPRSQWRQGQRGPEKVEFISSTARARENVPPESKMCASDRKKTRRATFSRLEDGEMVLALNRIIAKKRTKMTCSSCSKQWGILKRNLSVEVR